MEIFWTVISGLSIYVFGQIIQTFLLKPLNDFKVVLGEISHKLKFHANVITNSGMKEEVVRWSAGDMRDLSCQLESKYLAIPLDSFLSLLRIIPERKDIREAAKYLIILSNATGMQGYEVKNADAIDKLKKQKNIVL